MMRSVLSPLLDYYYYDYLGIRTTLKRRERFCVVLATVLWVLDYMAHIPIIKSSMEKFLVIRYFHRYSVCSITLSQRHGISLGSPRFLLVISFICILTVLIPDLSLAERCFMMTSIGPTYLAYEVLHRYQESSLLNRIVNSASPTCRYKTCIFYIYFHAMNWLNFTGVIRCISLLSVPYSCR